MAIKTIQDIENLQRIKSIWENWQCHPNTDFQHFKLVCGLREEVYCPYVFLIEKNCSVKALLVARFEKINNAPKIGYFEPVKIASDVLSVLYQGVLGDLSELAARSLVQKILDLLRSGKYDMVEFNNLQENSTLLNNLIEYSPKSWVEKEIRWSKHWIMKLPEEPGLLIKKLKSKHRSWIRGRLRKLERDFSDRLAIRWLKNFDDIPGLCAKLEEVAKLTYQRQLGAGFKNDEEHRKRFELFSSRNLLRLQLLEIDDQISAFWIGVIYNGTFYSSETGYDPSLRVYEPGTIVFLRMVDELIKERVRKLDFGFGDAKYKSRFGTGSWLEGTVRLYAPTIKGRILKTANRGALFVDKSGRWVVNKIGVLDLIKTKWRRRLSSTQE